MSEEKYTYNKAEVGARYVGKTLKRAIPGAIGAGIAIKLIGSGIETITRTIPEGKTFFDEFCSYVADFGDLDQALYGLATIGGLAIVGRAINQVRKNRNSDLEDSVLQAKISRETKRIQQIYNERFVSLEEEESRRCDEATSIIYNSTD